MLASPHTVVTVLSSILSIGALVFAIIVFVRQSKHDTTTSVDKSVKLLKLTDRNNKKYELSVWDDPVASKGPLHNPPFLKLYDVEAKANHWFTTTP